MSIDGVMYSTGASGWWRGLSARPAAGPGRPIVVVSDVDGGLLDFSGHGPPVQKEALDLLAARGIPLVIHSDRTRAEIERLRQLLRTPAPFISENGDALFLPHGSLPVPPRARPAVGGHVIPFGRPYHDVVDALQRACDESNVAIVGLAELSIEEAARELGTSIAEAQLAKLREYTELFRIIDESESKRSRLFNALRRHGLRGCGGGPHYLATATADRAQSLRTLRALWRQTSGDPFVIAVGDSEDDVVWLRHADVAIVVWGHQPEAPARVLSKLGTAHVTRWPGRRGWGEAVVEHVVRAECRTDRTRRKD